jgi:uncharacterized membrane protein YhaH (DUF805 family)
MAPRAKVTALLFGGDTTVTRNQYAAVGFSLMALKYLLDSSVLFLVQHITVSPLTYLNPFLSSKTPLFANSPSWFVWLLSLIALPFAWVGLSMTVRRAQDAGLSTWVAFLFLVPGLNYLLMLGLCLAPSRPAAPASRPRGPSSAAWKSAMLGVFGALVFSALVLLFSVEVLKTYGAALFVGTPIAMGAISSFTLNRQTPTSVGATLSLAVLTALLSAGALLLFGLEGAVCITMAFPPALAFTLLGAILGRTVALKSGAATTSMWIVLCLVPMLAGFESLPHAPPLREVASSIEINAPPEKVWSHVVTFSELPAPTEWIFQTGIAYPQRARIEGQGVGAIRRCEFSTGPFIEPIQTWEPPVRLGFGVESQPPPMEEWSPYKNIHPRHLDGYFRSQRGEFRLVSLPFGRTRLEGSTWYELDLAPGEYWRLWADGLIHAIHMRVLKHIKQEVEHP